MNNLKSLFVISILKSKLFNPNINQEINVNYIFQILFAEEQKRLAAAKGSQ